MAPQQKPKAFSRAETEKLAEDIAKDFRLTDSALPPDTDFTDQDMKEMQNRLDSFRAVSPAPATEALLAFSAFHLPAVAATLGALSPTTQPHAFSALVQLLAVLPDPEHNPYLRRFLASPHSAVLPTRVASCLLDGLAPRTSTAAICTLLFYMLLWCAPASAANEMCLPPPTVAALPGTLAALQADAALDKVSRAHVARLAKLLTTLEQGTKAGMPAGAYLQAQRDLYENGICGINECAVCLEEDEPLFACSRCKGAKYCSTGCQGKAWKEGHKAMCFTVAY